MSKPEDGIAADVLSASKIAFVIDSGVFSTTAVKKAAYRFGARFHVELEAAERGKLHVVLTAKAPVDDPHFWAGEFRNEVLDQDLREIVARETEPMRRLLLAQAFSATSLVDPFADDADYRVDPMGVRRPQDSEAGGGGKRGAG